MEKHNNLKGTLILCLTAFIWGMGFVAQSGVSDLMPPFSVNGSRSLIAFFAVSVLFKLLNIKTKEKLIPRDREHLKISLKGGFFCGALLTVSAYLQQCGITVYPDGVADAARAGFLTALYVVIVPIISVFIVKRIHPVIWCAVAVAVVGVYLLCFSGGFGGVYLGDLLMLACAFCFSIHIITIDKYCGAVGGMRLACFQFLTCGLLSFAASFLFESEKLAAADFGGALPHILFLGFFSSSMGYTLQIVGQKYAKPYIASLTMSLESVFATLGGWVILGNRLSLREIIGCVLVFGAILLAQTPDILRNRK